MRKNSNRQKLIETIAIIVVAITVVIIFIFIAEKTYIPLKSGEIIDEVQIDVESDNQHSSVNNKINNSYSSITEFKKQKSEGNLLLVNWDNPVPYDRPDNLKNLSDVFSNEVKLTNPEGLIDAEAGEMAKLMFLEARSKGLYNFVLSSAYRSVSYQQQLFEARKQENPAYGEDPFNFPVKVMPGENSEHTTGLALDILIDGLDNDESYVSSEHGKWLSLHAHEYGFILRYPSGKEHITGVIYEPWHYRYVGIEAAKEIYDMNLCLEEYVE